MCGFAGFASPPPSEHSEHDRAAVLRAMGRQLSLRAPTTSSCCSPTRSIVFRRLSIVDTEGGRQPIANEDGTIFVAINGEIYNHKDLRRTLRRELTPSAPNRTARSSSICMKNGVSRRALESVRHVCHCHLGFERGAACSSRATDSASSRCPTVNADRA